MIWMLSILILPEKLDFEYLEKHVGDRKFIEIKSAEKPSDAILQTIVSNTSVDFVRYLKPVLPVLSRKDLKVPFSYCDDMLKYGKEKDSSLWELAVLYECARGSVDESTCF